MVVDGINRLNKAFGAAASAAAATSPQKKPRNTSNANPADLALPRNGKVLVFDLDETLIGGDKVSEKILNSKKYAQKIQAMQDGRKLSKIPKSHPSNKSGKDIFYCLRPGTKEILEYYKARGYTLIASTRNFREHGKAIVAYDPILSKYITATLGREDLMTDLNKDFKKYPHHPDNLPWYSKLKVNLYVTFVDGPCFVLRKVRSLFTGEHCRWTPQQGSLGKYTPNMLDILIDQNPSMKKELKGLKPPRILVDNSRSREEQDAARSGDWCAISPNVAREKGKEPSVFHPDSPEPRDEEGRYIWVKKVIKDIAEAERTLATKNLSIAA